MPADKTLSATEVVAELHDGMTIGIGGWGGCGKPMALVREILRFALARSASGQLRRPRGGHAVWCAAGKLRRLVYGFVSLDVIPLESHFPPRPAGGRAGSDGARRGPVALGLAGGRHAPAFPAGTGLGSDLMRVNPQLKTIGSPYEDGEELPAMPALPPDVALFHVNCADRRGSKPAARLRSFLRRHSSPAPRRAAISAAKGWSIPPLLTMPSRLASPCPSSALWSTVSWRRRGGRTRLPARRATASMWRISRSVRPPPPREEGRLGDLAAAVDRLHAEQSTWLARRGLSRQIAAPPLPVF